MDIRNYRIIILIFILVGAGINHASGDSANSFGGSRNMNYVSVAKPFTTIDSVSLISQSNSVISTEYFDGLGRKIQTVSVGFGNNGNDIADYIEYDGRSRVIKQWQPAAGNTDGNFVTFSELDFDSAYDEEADYAFASNIWSEQVDSYIRSSCRPGQVWKSLGVGSSSERCLNDSCGKKACAKWSVESGSGFGSLTLSDAYPPGELFVAVASDEDGCELLTFTDRRGLTLLIRRVLDENVFADTYFVYDKNHNLRYVLSPEASNRLTAKGSYSENISVLKNYCNAYRYDIRNRLIVKRLSGDRKFYYAYDKSDRLIFTQTGSISGSRLLYTLSDNHGRTVMTGITTTPISLDEWNYRLRKKLPAIRARYVHDNDTAVFGYVSNLPVEASDSVMEVFFYDDYRFLELFPALADSLNYNSTTKSGKKWRGDGTVSPEKGLLTGKAVRVIGTQDFIVSAYYYDAKGRIIQSRQSNISGGFDVNYYSYSYSGRLMKWLNINSVDSIRNSVSCEISYDNAGRVVSEDMSVNGRDTVSILSNSYDCIGRLQRCALPGITGNLNYAYTVSGNMKTISSDDALIRFHYEKLPDGSAGCLNGNLSAIYYPYGMRFADLMNVESDRYLFSGKELDRMNGLDLYDFHARQYDPLLGRFTTPDPMEEKYPHLSPYSYCAGNPTRFTDPTGMYVYDRSTLQQMDEISESLKNRLCELGTKIFNSSATDENLENLKLMQSEVIRSLSDINDMKSDPHIEYILRVGLYDNETVIKDNIATMYSENLLESTIHEFRHGGQIARGEMKLNKSNYSASHEIDAYKAQFSVKGYLKYNIKFQINNDSILLPQQINRIIDITKEFIHSIYEGDINKQKPVYNFNND